MNDKNNRQIREDGKAFDNAAGGDRKKNFHKKKKHPASTGDGKKDFQQRKDHFDGKTGEDRPASEKKDRFLPNDSRNGKKKNGGKFNRRPQIHDGFDDIRMNPRYVMVDSDDRDDYEESSDTRNDDGVSLNPGVTVGRNAVRELLRSGRAVDKIYVKNGSREGSVVVIVAEAISRGIPIVEVDQNKLDRISCGGNHQGVVAMAAGKEYSTVDDILAIAAARNEKPLIVVSDGIEDPHNLGALIRCAECAGAHGIIIPKRRAVGVTPVVVKCSAGAIEHMAIARVTNLATTLKELKESGIWIFAAEAGGDAYYDMDFDLPAAIVFGSEGGGVSRLVKERSDFNVSIPMYGLVNSLNVSTAASVILCHAARVRHGKA